LGEVVINNQRLTLGWRVTHALEPQYWLRAGAKAGMQSPSDLVTIEPHLSAAHTAIIAQSGSGKSFLLGRYIEELLTQTRCKCLVFDPNADFKRVQEVESDSLWSEASYDPHQSRGKLPHECSRSEFQQAWSKVAIAVRGRAPNQDKRFYVPLKLWLPSVPISFLSGGVSPGVQMQLQHCHSIMTTVLTLLLIKGDTGNASKDLVADALELLKKIVDIRTPDKLGLLFESTFEPTVLEAGIQSVMRTAAEFGMTESDVFPVLGSFQLHGGLPDTTEMVGILIRDALIAQQYVTGEAVRYYSAEVMLSEALGLIEKDYKLSDANRRRRLEVLDLPSITDRGSRLLAVSSMLQMEWRIASTLWDTALRGPAEGDQRVPLFIIVDEAHNLIPAHPTNDAEIMVRDQFRTIVAEGRKYGIFLIVVTQRPDKTDRMVLGECENKAIMRLSSPSVLAKTRQLLGLEEIPQRQLDSVLDFASGRALIAGQWSPIGPQFLYCAARRTVEGGRNLRPGAWAIPPVA
jgi:hypothetical protein